MSRNSLLEAGAKSEDEMAATGLEPGHFTFRFRACFEQGVP